MSVIITGMDMPKNCLDCPVRNYRDDEGNRCDLTGLYNREDCCPLRSAEGLIEEIKKMKKTSGVTGQGVWNECLHYVIETIEEYCKGGKQ